MKSLRRVIAVVLFLFAFGFAGSASAQSIGFSVAQPTSSFSATVSNIRYIISGDASGAVANTVRLTFTCTAGPCLTDSPSVTLRMSGNTQDVNLVVNASNLIASTSVAGTTVIFVTGPNVLADGTYTVRAAYQRVSNGTTITSTALTWTLDGRTQPPVLVAPASSALSGPLLSLDFDLPDVPFADSVLLTFMQDAAVVATWTLAAEQGENAEVVDVRDPTSSSFVSATSAPLPDGTYDVVLSYRDDRPHTAASTTASGVTLRTATPDATITAPVAATAYDLPFSLDYVLPVAPLGGNIMVEVVGEEYSIRLPLTASMTGSVPFDATSDIPSGTYRFALTYQDALGNPVNETRVENVTVRRPDLTIAMGRSGALQVGVMGVAYQLTVTNDGDGPTFAATSVTDTLAPGVVAVSMSGLGWSCRLDTTTCVRDDVLAPGESYPPIMLRVEALESAAGPITNRATVTGGGERPSTTSEASDDATVLCALGAFFGERDECTSCGGACDAGEFVSATCSTSADRVCATCDSVPNCTSVTCTTGDDSVCAACAAGYFVSEGACAACTESCEPGSFRSSACGATTDTVCARCPVGTFSADGSGDACTPCAAGTFTNSVGSTSCEVCPPGSDSMEGANACTDCDPLTETCVLCDAGEYPNHAERACLSCPIGTYSTPESLACIACAPGSFASTERSGSCEPCAEGSFATAPGASECGRCPPGTFAGGQGNARCTPCAAGTFAAVSGAGECSECGSCDDSDACTADLCDPVDGCQHRPIAGCTEAPDAGLTDGGTSSGDDAGDADGGLISGGGGGCSGCTVPGESGPNAASTLLMLTVALAIARRRSSRRRRSP